MSDSEILWAIILFVIGLGVSIIGFFLKVAWKNMTDNAKEVLSLKEELGKQKGKTELLEQKLDSSLEKHSGMHDVKMEALKETLDKLVVTVEHLDRNIGHQTQLYVELLKEIGK